MYAAFLLCGLARNGRYLEKIKKRKAGKTSWHSGGAPALISPSHHGNSSPNSRQHHEDKTKKPAPNEKEAMLESPGGARVADDRAKKAGSGGGRPYEGHSGALEKKLIKSRATFKDKIFEKIVQSPHGRGLQTNMGAGVKLKVAKGEFQNLFSQKFGQKSGSLHKGGKEKFDKGAGKGQNGRVNDDASDSSPQADRKVSSQKKEKDLAMGRGAGTAGKVSRKALQESDDEQEEEARPKKKKKKQGGPSEGGGKAEGNAAGWENAEAEVEGAQEDGDGTFPYEADPSDHAETPAEGT